MASEISNNDLTFLAMLDAENGQFTPDRVHNDGHGHGFCGFDDRWWKFIINDPRFVSDPYWQISECYSKYKGGTKFYGLGNVHKTKQNFTCPE
jgi:hypothetical protein